MRISVYIIAYNEAEKIRDCINSVLWADEIIVADSHSTDGTSEIAEDLGAKVVHIPFNGYGWGREDSEFVVRLLNSGINRKNLRFNAIQFHLWHNENTRALLQQNDILLQNAIDNNAKWCDNGVDKYL